VPAESAGGIVKESSYEGPTYPESITPDPSSGDLRPLEHICLVIRSLILLSYIFSINVAPRLTPHIGVGS